MNLYAKEQQVIDQATGRTIALVYTTQADAVLLSYAPQMLERLKAIDDKLYYEVTNEINEANDLFNHTDNQTKQLRDILREVSDHLDYKELEVLLKKVQAIGYTFDYGLDGTPYNLRKI